MGKIGVKSPCVQQPGSNSHMYENMAENILGADTLDKWPSTTQKFLRTGY